MEENQSQPPPPPPDVKPEVMPTVEAWKATAEPARVLKPKERKDQQPSPREKDVALTAYYMLLAKSNLIRNRSTTSEALRTGLDRTGIHAVDMELTRFAEINGLGLEAVNDQGEFQQGPWNAGEKQPFRLRKLPTGEYTAVRQSEILAGKIPPEEVVNISNIIARNGEVFSCVINGQPPAVEIDIETVLNGQLVTTYDALKTRRENMTLTRQKKEGSDGIFSDDEFNLLEAYVKSANENSPDAAESFDTGKMTEIAKKSELTMVDSLKGFSNKRKTKENSPKNDEIDKLYKDHDGRIVAEPKLVAEVFNHFVPEEIQEYSEELTQTIDLLEKRITAADMIGQSKTPEFEAMQADLEANKANKAIIESMGVAMNVDGAVVGFYASIQKGNIKPGTGQIVNDALMNNNEKALIQTLAQSTFSKETDKNMIEQFKKYTKSGLAMTALFFFLMMQQSSKSNSGRNG